MILPANAAGKLDVGGAVGHGTLRVIRDMGLREPYVGQTDLQTGEIGDDLTWYFATSEQVPSSVGLGVLMEKTNTVRRAGGFLLQMMPFAQEETVVRLERNLSGISSVTALLDRGLKPEQMLAHILDGFSVEITNRIPCSFFCGCSRQRVEGALISIGKKELDEIIRDKKPIEVNCQFCGRSYTFDTDELKRLREKAR